MANAISSRKLDNLTEKTRAKPISWEAYSRAGLISAQQVTQVQRVTSIKSGQQTSDLLDVDKEGKDYAALYVELLSKLSRNDTIAYVLVLVGDMLGEHDERIPLFLQQSDLYSTFSHLLQSTDEFIKLKSIVLLTILISSDSSTNASDPKALNTLYVNMSKVLQDGSKDVENQLITLQCLSTLFKKSSARSYLWSNEDQLKIIQSVINILQLSVDLSSSGTGVLNGSSSAPGSGTNTPRSTYSQSTYSLNSNDSVSNPSSPQLQYYVGLSLWILTFDPTIAEAIHGKFSKLIPLLIELARNAVKEKVVRVTLATFRNLANAAPTTTLPVMLSCRLLPFLQLMTNSKKWSDEEIVADVDYLKAQLQDIKKTLTTFDEYQQEVESGYLTWDTPTHQDDDFWRENASKLCDQNNKCVKALVKALQSKDATILAIACNDIAYLVKSYEPARKPINDLGGKTKVMELMKHPDANVKFKALMAVQRLVSHTWS